MANEIPISPGNNRKVIIAGGSGQIGRHLAIHLNSEGYQPVCLSRHAPAPSLPYASWHHWDPMNGKIDEHALIDAHAIINLAGESVAGGRWTAEKKRRIIDSRVSSHLTLLNEVQSKGQTLPVYIGASATGYYGSDTSDHIFSEEDPPGEDFLADCCKQWETAALDRVSVVNRMVLLRTGIVLADDGGALAKMAGPVRWGIGSRLGTGEQFLPWIHIRDICRMYQKAIENTSMQGIWNAVAPNPVTQIELTRTLASVLHRPLFLPPVPAWLLKLVLGEMAEIITNGSRVSAEKWKSVNFSFRFPTLRPALEDLI
ncbi:MAG: TIGR01777 family oxidoreductase [Flavobacteriales bacterium]|nr:TIGR01777 family oxidoreductase [Flavobacteriales bacterium]